LWVRHRRWEGEKKESGSGKKGHGAKSIAGRTEGGKVRKKKAEVGPAVVL